MVTNGESAGPSYGWGWGRWAWRTLTSMRTAVILLASLAIAAIPGSLLPQRNVATSPSAVPRFYSDYPELAPWLDRLGLFNVYSSPWFAAIYLLLLVSMTGCVLPRAARLWREVRADPRPPPKHLARMDQYQRATIERPSSEVLKLAASLLRRRRYRVIEVDGAVWAEKGYSRELGNLVFHLSLLVLLVGIAVGKLYGFEGRAVVVEGESFTNVRSSYDEFTPAALTNVDALVPFSVTLDDFRTEYALAGPRAGEPRKFDARVTYARAGDRPDSRVIRPNEPLDIDGTKLFVSGHGYAPRVTVRDGLDNVVHSGPVVFLPLDMSLSSEGVIKAASAEPIQIGFEGRLLPTSFNDTENGSQFPALLEPRLDLTAYTGDLGMESGTPQSVFTLQKEGLTETARESLRIGETMRLPNDAGSLTFDGVEPFVNFQIAYDPGKEVALAAAVLLMLGLSASLLIRRQRIWIRLDTDGASVEIAGHSVTRRSIPDDYIGQFARELVTPQRQQSMRTT